MHVWKQKTPEVQWRQDTWPEPHVLPLPFYSSTESRNKGTLISKLNILAASILVFPSHLLYSPLACSSLSREQYRRKPDPFYLETDDVCTRVLIQLSLWPKSNVFIFFCPLKLLNMDGSIQSPSIYKFLHSSFLFQGCHAVWTQAQANCFHIQASRPILTFIPLALLILSFSWLISQNILCLWQDNCTSLKYCRHRP